MKYAFTDPEQKDAILRLYADNRLHKLDNNDLIEQLDLVYQQLIASRQKAADRCGTGVLHQYGDLYTIMIDGRQAGTACGKFRANRKLRRELREVNSA